jgi:hypothetical protein
MVDNLQQYDGYIKAIVEQVNADKGVNITPALVKAIIKQESQNNPNARSPVGAMGLMQVMPETAKELNPNGNPMDPLDNIAMGVTHLATQIQLSKDLPEALARYNFGEGSINNLIKARGQNDFHNYLNSETKGYVDNILTDVMSQPEEAAKLRNIKVSSPSVKTKAVEQPELIPDKSPFQNPLDEAGTRAYLQLVKTVPAAANKYLEKRFGKENVYTDDGGIAYVRPQGQKNFYAVNPAKADTGNFFSNVLGTPDPAGEIGQAIPDLGRLALTTAGGIIGGGATKNIKGAGAGSALGEFAGDIIAGGAALAGGASPEDLAASIPGSAGRASVAGLFGAGGEALGKTIGEIGKNFTVAGNTGREIEKFKNAFLRQAKSDELLGQVQGASDLGSLAKDTMTQTFNSIKTNTEGAFQAADQAFMDSLEKGTFAFADATKAVDKLKTKLKLFVNKNLITEKEAADTLEIATNQLNNVKQNVFNNLSPTTAEPFTPSNLTKIRFAQAVEKLPEDGKMAFNMQDIGNNLGFDPKQVTAFDLRNTSNAMRQLYDNSVNPQLQSVIAGFKKGLDVALGGVKNGLDDSDEMIREAFIRGGGDVEDFISKGAESLGSPKIAADFLNSIVTPKGAKDFANYKQGFAIGKQKYDLFPEKFRNMIYKNAPKEKFAESILNTKVQEVKPLQSIFRSAGVEDQFTQSLKGEIIAKGTSQRNAIREFRQATPEALQQAEFRTIPEVQALQQSGVTPNFDAVKKMKLSPSEKVSQSEPILIGQGIGKLLKKNEGAYGLLGRDAKQFTRTAKDLEDATIGSGITTNLQQSEKFVSDGNLAPATANFAQKTLRALGPIGSLVSEAGSALINPAQRLVGSAMDTALGRLIPTQAVTSLAPAAIGSFQFGTNMQSPSEEELLLRLQAAQRFSNAR